MRLLLINPNTSEHVTEQMVAQARRSAGDRAVVSGATAAFGPRIIGSRAENAIAGHAALETLARHRTGFDAVILGVSTDAGLAALREVAAVPVVGMAEAGLLLACALGRKVGCLTLGAHLLPIYEEVTALYGLSSRVARWRALDLPHAYAAGVDAGLAPALGDACAAMHDEDGADAALMCGAVLSGYGHLLAGRSPVPVVDCIDAAVRLAVLLAEWGEAAGAGFGRRIADRASVGLSPDLARLLAG